MHMGVSGTIPYTVYRPYDIYKIDAIYCESGTILNVSIVVRLQVRKQTPAAPAAALDKE